jgi:hypothetical protein
VKYWLHEEHNHYFAATEGIQLITRTTIPTATTADYIGESICRTKPIASTASEQMILTCTSNQSVTSTETIDVVIAASTHQPVMTTGADDRSY